MATTRVSVTVDGTTDTITVPFPYLDRTHVKVEKNDVPLGATDYSWITDGSIELATMPASGDVITVYRQTPDEALTAWQAGSVLSRADLETDSLQAIYRLQEIENSNLDEAGVIALIEEAELNGTDTFIRADLSDAGATKNSALIADKATETGAVARTLNTRIRELGVTNGEFGLVADGVTDDAAALLNAANAAVARGRILSLDGTKEYALSNITLPAGLRMNTNGALFVDAAGTTSNTALITVSAGCWIDEIDVTIPTGLRRDRVVVLTGASPQVEKIHVYSVDQQNNMTDNDDSAVRINLATSPRVGTISVENYDRGVQINDSSDVRARALDIDSYVRGLQIEDSTKVKIHSSHMHTTSPNASYTAGHVGVLLSANTDDATRNVKLLDFVIEDAGEHGVRVAGPARISNWQIVRPVTKNTGGCGIKVLGTDSGTPTSRNTRGRIIDPTVEDCGTGGLTSNMCGILVMYADDVHITNPVIRKNAKLQSAHTGIRVAASNDVHITEPAVSDATFDGLWADGSLGDIDRLHVTGGSFRANGRDGIRGTTGVSTTTFRRWSVEGVALDSNAGKGLVLAIGAGGFEESLFRVKTYNNTGGAAQCDHAGALLDVFGAVGATPLSGIVCANGSRWSDGTTLNIRKAGAWTAL